MVQMRDADAFVFFGKVVFVRPCLVTIIEFGTGNNSEAQRMMTLAC